MFVSTTDSLYMFRMVELWNRKAALELLVSSALFTISENLEGNGIFKKIHILLFCSCPEV